MLNMSTLHERLLEICRDQGVESPIGRDIQRIAGLSSGRVTQIKNEREAAKLGEATIKRLSRLGYLVEWLTEGKGSKRGPVGGHKGQMPSDAIPVQMQYIPVVGTTKGGPTTRAWADGDLPVGEGFGWVSVSSRDKSAYALRVTGSSMAPRYEQGEYVLVEPMRKAVPGDFVVVRLASGECMVKRFSAQRPHELVFDSINANYEKIIVAPSDVDFIHYVACGVSAGSFVQNIQDDGYEGPERRWHDEPVDVERRTGGAQG